MYFTLFLAVLIIIRTVFFVHFIKQNFCISKKYGRVISFVGFGNANYFATSTITSCRFIHNGVHGALYPAYDGMPTAVTPSRANAASSVVFIAAMRAVLRYQEKRSTAIFFAGTSTNFTRASFGTGRVSSEYDFGITNETVCVTPADCIVTGAVIEIVSLAAASCRTGAVIAMPCRFALPPKIYPAMMRKPALMDCSFDPVTVVCASICEG